MESLFWGPPQGSGERKAETRNRGPGKGPGFSHARPEDAPDVCDSALLQPCKSVWSSPLHRGEAKAWRVATAVKVSQKHLLRLATGSQAPPTPGCQRSCFFVTICAGVPWCHGASLWIITALGR